MQLCTTISMNCYQAAAAADYTHWHSIVDWVKRKTCSMQHEAHSVRAGATVWSGARGKGVKDNALTLCIYTRIIGRKLTRWHIQIMIVHHAHRHAGHRRALQRQKPKRISMRCMGR